jgi:HEPN domain-containing protein
MTPEESRRNEAARWLDQARKDLNAAKLLAAPEPSRSVFHSQQAAEKAAKGFSFVSRRAISQNARPY